MIDRHHDLSITQQASLLGISRGSVYYLPRPVSEADLALMRRLIAAYTAPGALVLDPFLGSGTTAEAALQVGRNVIGFEADRANHALIAQRLQRSQAMPGTEQSAPFNS